MVSPGLSHTGGVRAKPTPPGVPVLITSPGCSSAKVVMYSIRSGTVNFRSLIGAFSSINPLRFHAADGGGYEFLTDRVLELDAINPQVAARLLTPLGRWRRFDKDRQAKMKAQLQRILDHEGLSKDSYEIARKSLG